MVNTKVTLAGLTLDNPIIGSSGTFNYGREYSELYDINALGAFSFKGTTVEPRNGNPTPRIAETDCGVIASIGLQNPGMERVIKDVLPEMKKYYKKKVIANVAGFCKEDFVTLCENFGRQEQVGIIEANVSCPNVNGGLALGTSLDKVYEITKAIKKVTDKPIFLKLSPNVADITEIAKAAEDGGADGLTLINTIKAMRIDLKTRKPVLANAIAGYSGKALFPIALRMVYQVYKAVKIPIIGVGGVSSAENVLEMMFAGATAVGIGAANLVDPYACKEIIDALPKVMEKYKIDDISSIIGAAAR